MRVEGPRVTTDGSGSGSERDLESGARVLGPAGLAEQAACSCVGACRQGAHSVLLSYTPPNLPPPRKPPSPTPPPHHICDMCPPHHKSHMATPSPMPPPPSHMPSLHTHAHMHT